MSPILVTLTSSSDSNFERSNISLEENKRDGVDPSQLMYSKERRRNYTVLGRLRVMQNRKSSDGFSDLKSHEIGPKMPSITNTHNATSNITCLVTGSPSPSHMRKRPTLQRGLNFITVCLLLTSSMTGYSFTGNDLWLQGETLLPDIKVLSGPVSLNWENSLIKCHTVPDSVPSSRFSSRFDKSDNNYIIHSTKTHNVI